MIKYNYLIQLSFLYKQEMELPHVKCLLPVCIPQKVVSSLRAFSLRGLAETCVLSLHLNNLFL